MDTTLHQRIIAGRSIVMVKHEVISGTSNTDKLKRLRIAELDVDYHKQLQALKRIIKNGRIHFGNQLKNK